MSNLPIGKILAGCGCVTVLAVAGLGIGGYFAYQTGSDYVREMADELPIDAIPTGAQGGEAEGAASSEKSSSDGAEPSKDKEMLTPARARAALETPLTQKDADLVLGIYDDLRKTGAYKQWNESLDGLKNAGKKKDQNTLESMKAMRDTMKGFDAYRDLFEEYDRLVKKRGGYDAYLASLVRLSGAAAAAKQIAKDHKKEDPSTAAVAGLVLKERPAIKAEFAKTVEEAQKIARKEAGKKTLPVSAMMLLQKPGTIAMSRMPEKSFQNWKSFSVAERKRIIEMPQTALKDFPGMLIGMTWTGEPLIVSSELETLRAAPKQ